ncbi:MAG: zinc metalloprotease [Myxococcales bacterium]|nr:zinc metalloprotease [Myxococcales bacterium]
MTRRIWTAGLAALAIAGCEQEGDSITGPSDDEIASLEASVQAQGADKCISDDSLRPGASRDPGAGTLAAIKQQRAKGGSTKAVGVAFHVMVDTDGTTGNVSESMLDDQINVLNADYARFGFSFYKKSVDRTVNATWFRLGFGGSEKRMKSALAIDPAHTLNLYTADLSRNLLGWAYFPWSFEETNYMHGVVLHYQSLPGGAFVNYSGGRTGTHEVGHYLGLYHTFQGGCTEPGDYCADTPQEASPAYGCPSGRDSCSSAGLDPINNYMDYTYDACMNAFSADQAARMAWAVSTYRPSL